MNNEALAAVIFLTTLILTLVLTLQAGRRRSAAPGLPALLPNGGQGPSSVAPGHFAQDPLLVLRDVARSYAGTVFLGLDEDTGGWVTAPARDAVLVLGPPGSGKTTSVIVPSILIAPGPVVSTSTKIDVLTATGAARARLGRVWHFDPSGSEITPRGLAGLPQMMGTRLS